MAKILELLRFMKMSAAFKLECYQKFPEEIITRVWYQHSCRFYQDEVGND